MAYLDPAASRSREESRREREADRYASIFLIPERMLEERSELRRMRRALSEERELSSEYLWSLTYGLARFFRVSPTMMKKRLMDLELVEQPGERRELRLKLGARPGV
ncbi:MAG: ImmA/IrrE family metallo-endopeptidase [Armatimonadetes bacterium]|nr:ImmA/IrrE family metallo-endopeptidase [Armatimonadota bacterium]